MMKKLLITFIILLSFCYIKAQTFPNVDSVKKYIDDSITSGRNIKAPTLQKAYKGLAKFLPDVVQDTADVTVKAHGMQRFQRKDSTAYVYDTIGGKRWRKKITLTLQQTLDAGSRLTKNDTVAGAGYLMYFDSLRMRIKYNYSTTKPTNYGAFDMGLANYGPSIGAFGNSAVPGSTYTSPISTTITFLDSIVRLYATRQFGPGYYTGVHITPRRIKMFVDASPTNAVAPGDWYIDLDSNKILSKADTLKHTGFADFSSGFSSLASDGTGSFILDRQSGFPSLYLQSNDTTTDAGSNDTFLELVANASSGFSVSKYDAATGVSAGISMNNGEIYFSGTGTIYLNAGNGGGFAISSLSNYETVLTSQPSGTELLKYHRMTGKLNLGEYLSTNTSSGGLTLSSGSFEIPEGKILMGMTNNAIIFDYDGDLWNTINYDYNDAYGYGTTQAMLYRSGGNGHHFHSGETGEKFADIGSTGVRLPVKNGTYGGYIGSGSMNYGEFGMYAGWNDGTIAAYSDITDRYNYGGEGFWIKGSDTAMFQTNLYVQPISGLHGRINLWDADLEVFNVIKATENGFLFSNSVGQFSLLTPIENSIIMQKFVGEESLNFPSTSAQSSSDLTMTVSGAEVGNSVILNITSGTTSYYTAWVSATNTVTVRLNNYGSSAIDPAAQNFTATVIK